jgi:hypothetical protein
MDKKRLTRGVLRVGNGRGFVVSCRGYAGCEERIVITAAHCLPSLPPRHPAVSLAERTYPTLLGPLGAKPTVWAECLLAETMADIAVLGMPDNQELTDEAEGYEHLMAKTQPLAIADPPAQGSERLLLPFAGAVERDTPGEAPVRLLSLKGRWVEGRVQRRGNWLGVTPQHIVASGMSGSPIIM